MAKKSYYLWKWEPFLLYVAGLKTVVLPYGADVQDLTRTQNLLFRNQVSKDYPDHRFRTSKIRKKIDLWINRSK